jgi:hypothetical protein
MNTVGAGYGVGPVYGLWSLATDGDYNYGVLGSVANGSHSYGVWAESDGLATQTYGLYAVIAGHAPICTNIACPKAAIMANGEVCTTVNYFNLSDSTLKDSIQPLTNPMHIIQQLSPKTFTYKHSSFPTVNLPYGGRNAGLIAQQVQNIPELNWLLKGLVVPRPLDKLTHRPDTTYSEVPFLSLNYIGIIPYLIGGMQQQQHQIDSLTTVLTNAMNIIDSCCNISQNHIRHSNGSNNSNGESNLNNAKGRLDQNQPNPFNTSTKIRFFIPESATSKALMVFDMQGVLLRRYSLEGTGESSLTISGNQYRPGMYLYSLIIDQKEIDTKRMILSE